MSYRPKVGNTIRTVYKEESVARRFPHSNAEAAIAQGYRGHSSWAYTDIYKTIIDINNTMYPAD